MTQKEFKRLRDKICSGGLGRSFDSSPVVAILSGPAPVIQMIVSEAVSKSGIPMDWGYVGGRAVVHAKGDRKIARSHLYAAIPNSDLSLHDL